MLMLVDKESGDGDFIRLEGRADEFKVVGHSDISQDHERSEVTECGDEAHFDSELEGLSFEDVSSKDSNPDVLSILPVDEIDFILLVQFGLAVTGVFEAGGFGIRTLWHIEGPEIKSD
mmetsp:Transcript_130/g.279  ORF Transcript_130/g.279 Transcript_130/m.279 type:complete len:118 (-) Transcript_130:20-373(-)